MKLRISLILELEKGNRFLKIILSNSPWETHLMPSDFCLLTYLSAPMRVLLHVYERTPRAPQYHAALFDNRISRDPCHPWWKIEKARGAPGAYPDIPDGCFVIESGPQANPFQSQP